jgi:hypothetical protein
MGHIKAKVAAEKQWRGTNEQMGFLNPATSSLVLLKLLLLP